MHTINNYILTGKGLRLVGKTAVRSSFLNIDLVSKYPLCFICFFILIPEKEVLSQEEEIFFFFPHLKPLSRSSFHRLQINFALKATDAKCEAPSTGMLSVSWGSFIRLECEASPCFRLISLDQQYQQCVVYMV